MSLTYDSTTGTISYNEVVVGNVELTDGKATVRLTIAYDCPAGDWAVPLSWLSAGLAHLAQHDRQQNRPSSDLSIELSSDSVENASSADQLLTEKTIKDKGYKWQFHKIDADFWPSLLHGHDYDRGLKLDAITGKIFDVGTKNYRTSLKATELLAIQRKLRESKDFQERVKELIDKPRTDGESSGDA